MAILLTVLIFVLVMVIHELGHAWEMKKCGVDIAEMGLGIPFRWSRRKIDDQFDEYGMEMYEDRYLPHLSYPIKVWGMNIKLKLHPLLLGAYVLPSSIGMETMDGLSDGDKHKIFAGGIIANILTCCFVFGVLWVFGATKIVTLFILIGVAIPCIFMRTFVSMYVVPILGIIFLIFISYVLVTTPITESLSGPVGVMSIIFDVVSETESVWMQLKKALMMLGIISLAIGIMNCLPIFVLDGGRSVFVHLERWGVSVNTLQLYVSVSTFALYGLFILAMYSDIMRFIK